MHSGQALTSAARLAVENVGGEANQRWHSGVFFCLLRLFCHKMFAFSQVSLLATRQVIQGFTPLFNIAPLADQWHNSGFAACSLFCLSLNV